MKKLIYLASPYSSDYADIIERRVRQVTDATAKFIEKGIVVFSPIVHSHPLSELLPKETNNWDFWKSQYEIFIDKAQEVWVLMLEGWKESTGVTAEIELAFNTNKTIRYINYPDLTENVAMRLDAASALFLKASSQQPGKSEVSSAYYKTEAFESKLQGENKILSFIEKNKAKLDLTVGNRDDQGKRRIDLIPVEAIQGLSDVLTAGAAKYDDNNWRKGMKFGRCFGSLNRHLWAWWSGQETDPETGLSHLAHVLCNAAFLLVYSLNPKKYKAYDDRPATLAEAKGEIKDAA